MTTNINWFYYTCAASSWLLEAFVQRTLEIREHFNHCFVISTPVASKIRGGVSKRRRNKGKNEKCFSFSPKKCNINSCPVIVNIHIQTAPFTSSNPPILSPTFSFTSPLTLLRTAVLTLQITVVIWYIPPVFIL